MMQQVTTIEQCKSEFIKLFNSIGYNKRRFEVFNDFVQMAAISLHNAANMDDDLEQQYLLIVGRYKKEDVDKICKLFAYVVTAFEIGFTDFLGAVYMEIEISNRHSGQFFTPYHLCKLMAKMTLTGIDKHFDEHYFITVDEPACGAGGMILAVVDELLERGYNPQTQLFVQCTDIDPLPVMMCYLQLALLHIPARIQIGNTLTLEINKVM
ncbi:MAG: N-6 DNA methylase [Alteromonadaceae bacterium]|nr:N-6 DNA methylase [Alteromonadaceae bacterium]